MRFFSSVNSKSCFTEHHSKQKLFIIAGFAKKARGKNDRVLTGKFPQNIVLFCIYAKKLRF